MSPLAGLDAHAQRLAGTSLASLIEDDPARPVIIRNEPGVGYRRG